MQLTIELPPDLARQLESRMDHLEEIIQRGLDRSETCGDSCFQEVFEFLSRGPSPREILAFQLSGNCVDRLRDLLERNRESVLNPLEEAELDTLESLNHLFAALKLQARQQLSSPQ